jgi:hypothetical protein
MRGLDPRILQQDGRVKHGHDGFLSSILAAHHKALD